MSSPSPSHETLPLVLESLSTEELAHTRALCLDDVPWRVFPSERAREAAEQLRVELGLDLRCRRLDEWCVPVQVTQLLHAAFEGDLDTMQRLLREGVDVNACNEAQRTALHEAVRGRRVHVVAELVARRDVHLTARDALGRTPLCVAALVFAREADTHGGMLSGTLRGEMMALFSLLLGDTRTDVNAVDERGRTALAICARAGLNDAVTLLLAAHANVRIATPQLRTPLHFAAANGHAELVTLLLEAGADVDARDVQGLSALHEATRADSVATVLALLRAEASDAASALTLTRSDEVRWLLEGRHTSHSHPYALWRVRSPRLGNARLALGMCPGRCRKQWRRSLALDLAAVQRARVTCVIVLVTEDELRSMGLGDYVATLHARDLEAVHFPITDKWVPASLSELRALVELVCVRVRRGHSLLVHCEGGKGRSGLVVAATLVALGHTEDEAVACVQAAQSDALSNPAQRYFLAQFAKEMAAAPLTL